MYSQTDTICPHNQHNMYGNINCIYAQLFIISYIQRRSEETRAQWIWITLSTPLYTYGRTGECNDTTNYDKSNKAAGNILVKCIELCR